MYEPIVQGVVRELRSTVGIETTYIAVIPQAIAVDEVLHLVLVATVIELQAVEGVLDRRLVLLAFGAVGETLGELDEGPPRSLLDPRVLIGIEQRVVAVELLPVAVVQRSTHGEVHGRRGGDIDLARSQVTDLPGVLAGLDRFHIGGAQERAVVTDGKAFSTRSQQPCGLGAQLCLDLGLHTHIAEVAGTTIHYVGVLSTKEEADERLGLIAHAVLLEEDGTAYAGFELIEGVFVQANDIGDVIAHLVTAGEVLNTAEEGAAGAARGDVDQTTGNVTIVGGYTAGDHLHFLDRALGQTSTCTCGHLYTIDIVIGVLGTRTANADAATGTRIACTRHRGGNGVGRTAGHLGDLVTRYRSTARAAVPLDQRYLVLHHLEFLQFDPRVEADLQEGDDVAVHHHAHLLVGLVTHIAHHHIVGAGVYGFDEVVAVEIGGATGHLRAAAFDHHVHERKWFA